MCADTVYSAIKSDERHKLTRNNFKCLLVLYVFIGKQMGTLIMCTLAV